MNACDMQLWSGALIASLLWGALVLGAWLTLRDRDRTIAALRQRVSFLEQQPPS